MTFLHTKQVYPCYMPSMEITTVIGCRVYCDFCPQDLLMKKYGELNNNKKYLLYLVL
jgi:hypothetical protein